MRFLNVWHNRCTSRRVSAKTPQAIQGEPPMQVVHDHAIQSWLTTHLAEQLGLSPEDIDIQKPFTEYGLDSIVGVFLAGDLEDWLGLQLSPTVLWEYPTTYTLAQYLAAELRHQGVDSAGPETICQRNPGEIPLDPQAAEQLLASLDALSDEEVDRLLCDLLPTQHLAA
jgi:acyl carrier protein